MSVRGLCGISLIAVAAMLPDLAAAQEQAAPDSQSGDIIVTAERRASSVQKTAASISVRSGSDLQASGRASLAQILEDVPGINGLSGAAENPAGSDSPTEQLVIRGIGTSQVGGDTTSAPPAVACYIDGIYNGLGSTFDVDRVEALRGPQGTLYGRSATAGVIAIHTRNPDTEKVGGYALAEAGTYDALHFEGALNVPLGDKFAIRVSGSHREIDGYDSAQGGRSRNDALRAKLLFKPSERVSLLIGGALENQRSNTGGVSLWQAEAGGPIIKNALSVDAFDYKQRQVWAQLDLDLDFATLTYLPAYRTWTQDGRVPVGAGGINLVNTAWTPRNHFHTQELRLASNGNSAFKWQGGLFYYNNDLSNGSTRRFTSSGALANGLVTTKQTEDVGAFAEATAAVTDAVRLTGGVRYDVTHIARTETYTVNNAVCCSGPPGTPGFGLPEDLVSTVLSGDAGKRTFRNWTWKARLEGDLSPNNLAYAMVSTAFSPGDVLVSTGPNDVPVITELKPGQNTSYEIGIKNRFLGNALQLNASLYHYEYEGFQILDAQIGSVIAPRHVNLSGTLRAQGAELETIWQITPDDRLTFNLAYVDAKFVNRSPEFQSYVARERLYGVAPLTMNASYGHHFTLPGDSSLDLQAQAIYTGAHDVSRISAADLQGGLLGLDRVGSGVIGNVYATWLSSNSKISVSAYVRNVTDRRYATQAEILEVTPGVRQSNLRLSPPRTFGVVAKYNF